jgi:hypothetical protein
VVSRDQLTSTNMLLSTIRTPRTESELANTAYHIVHASDVATLHSVSFSVAEASGHRIFGIGAEPTWQDICEHSFLRTTKFMLIFYILLDDSLNADPAFPKIPKGNSGYGNHPDSGSSDCDISFPKKLLGRDFIGTKQAFRETEEYYQKKGWAFV